MECERSGNGILVYLDDLQFIGQFVPTVDNALGEEEHPDVKSCIWFEPRQANLCLRAFRHDKFKLRMPSHSEGPGIWLSV